MSQAIVVHEKKRGNAVEFILILDDKHPDPSSAIVDGRMISKRPSTAHYPLVMRDRFPAEGRSIAKKGAFEITAGSSGMRWLEEIQCQRSIS